MSRKKAPPREQVNFRIESEQLARWRDAAEEAGLELSVYIRDAVDAYDRKRTAALVALGREVVKLVRESDL